MESIEIERNAPYNDIGPTDTMDDEERERAYDAFFGTSALNSPTPSPPSSRPASPQRLASSTPSPTPAPRPPSASTSLKRKRSATPQDEALQTSLASSCILEEGYLQEDEVRKGSAKKKRNRRKGRALRTGKRKDNRAADPEAGQMPKEAIKAKHVAHAEAIKTEYDVGDIPCASTGFIALPDTSGRVHTLKELLEVRKFTLVKWDGK